MKIEPRSIGVGQYQHDVSGKELSTTLNGVVESAVNRVGVDLNTASVPLLSYVAGISPSVAANIVANESPKGLLAKEKNCFQSPGWAPPRPSSSAPAS